MGGIEAAMGSIARAKEEAPTAQAYAPAGQSTQMIIGASPATDADILGTADHLYKSYRLRRVYYSAFSPIAHGDPRLPGKSPPLVREHRLYQADWLVRFYGFDVGEIVSAARPTLDLAIDPKLAWALAHREAYPVDVNRGSRELLLRVPGMGRGTVEKILRARRHRGVRREDLRRLGVARRADAFLLTEGENRSLAALDRLNLRQTLTEPAQLTLFAARESAVRGEL